MPRKVLVTGARGQLGHDVAQCLREQGVPFVAAGREELDVTDLARTMALFERERPTEVIHCAAYTAVDRAEEEPDVCLAANGEGTRNLCLACREYGGKLLYVSTDYVFDGSGEEPHETDDPTGPINVYGRSKLAGELAVRELLSRHFIVRVSWVFGKSGRNFVRAMLEKGREQSGAAGLGPGAFPEVRVVADQFGSPTYTRDLAPLLCQMVGTSRYGTYHATNEGICSFAELAREIFLQAGLSARVREISSEEYPARAARPRNSRLSKRSLDEGGFSRLPDWRDALRRYLEEVGARPGREA